jgi:hypothetical protein
LLVVVGNIHPLLRRDFVAGCEEFADKS